MFATRVGPLPCCSWASQVGMMLCCFFLAAKQFFPDVYPPKRGKMDSCLQSIPARFSFFCAEKIMELCDREQSNGDGASLTSSNHSRRHILLRDIDVVRQWTHWDLNPGPSACKADVIPLHHVPAYCQRLLIFDRVEKRVWFGRRGH